MILIVNSDDLYSAKSAANVCGEIVKLKVGDIEMDSQGGISFGSAEGAQVETTPVVSDVAASAPHTFLGLQLPAWPSRSYWAFSATSAVAVVVAALVNISVPLPLLPTLALLAVIPALTGTAVGSALVAHRVSHALSTAKIPDDVLQLRINQIAALLSSAREPVSVEWIAESLKWTEIAVVTGLRRLVEAGRIREDLDVETGHWTYEHIESCGESARRQAMPVAAREQILVAKTQEHLDPSSGKR